MISDANINSEMDAKINAGSFFQNRFGKWINYLSTGAGFHPSTVAVKSITLEIKSSIETIVPDDEISTLPKKMPPAGGFKPFKKIVDLDFHGLYMHFYLPVFIKSE